MKHEQVGKQANVLGVRHTTCVFLTWHVQVHVSAITHQYHLLIKSS